jgi:hypothetical protein
VGGNDDNPGSITLVEKRRENAFLAIKPFAHLGEDVGQIGLLNLNLDGLHRSTPPASIWREHSPLSVTGATTINR